MIKERIDERTPNGGAYSEIVYLNNEWEPVDRKEDATTLIISEFLSNGKLINETICKK